MKEWMSEWTCESSSFRLVSLSSESWEKSELSSNSDVSTSLELEAKLPILLPLPLSFCILLFFFFFFGWERRVLGRFRAVFLKQFQCIFSAFSVQLLGVYLTFQSIFRSNLNCFTAISKLCLQYKDKISHFGEISEQFSSDFRAIFLELWGF